MLWKYQILFTYNISNFILFTSGSEPTTSVPKTTEAYTYKPRTTTEISTPTEPYYTPTTKKHKVPIITIIEECDSDEGSHEHHKHHRHHHHHHRHDDDCSDERHHHNKHRHRHRHDDDSSDERHHHRRHHKKQIKHHTVRHDEENCNDESHNHPKRKHHKLEIMDQKGANSDEQHHDLIVKKPESVAEYIYKNNIQEAIVKCCNCCKESKDKKNIHLNLNGDCNLFINFNREKHCKCKCHKITTIEGK